MAVSLIFFLFAVSGINFIIKIISTENNDIFLVYLTFFELNYLSSFFFFVRGDDVSPL